MCSPDGADDPGVCRVRGGLGGLVGLSYTLPQVILDPGSDKAMLRHSGEQLATENTCL